MSVRDIRPLTKLSPSDIDHLRMLRWKARTDLGFLCREILNYKDVSDEIHGPFMNKLQKFPVPTPEQFKENDKVVGGKWSYKSIQRHTSLPGGRKVLILDPRGWLKTTINAQSHTIQWLLNYPDIAIMIIQSNLEKAEMILGEIKQHFQYNAIFRQLFPEHCPVRAIESFGTKGKFTTLARNRGLTRKEESVSTSSIDAGSSGIHVDVIKYSDIVEPSNVGTPEQMEKVTQGFYMSQNLLVGPKYWIDVEGTRYDFADTYGQIIKLDKDTPPEKRDWKIHARGCYKKDTGGKPETFRPEELILPDLLVDGKRILHWNDEERGLTLDHYEMKRREDPYLFSCQQCNSPSGGVDGRSIFPVEPGKYPALITRKDFRQNVRISHYVATVDTAETIGKRSNYTAITVAAFASDGRVYINEIIHGKFLPDETCALICNLNSLTRNQTKDGSPSGLPLYGSKLAEIHIEETGFARGLNVALNMYQHLTGNFLPIKTIKRDNQAAKIERIQSTLQPYYRDKKLIFLDDIKCMDHLLDELRQFPRSQSDDILDTLADLFQLKTWFGREIAKPTFEQHCSDMWDRMLGIGDIEKVTCEGIDGFYSKTGGL